MKKQILLTAIILLNTLICSAQFKNEKYHDAGIYLNNSFTPAFDTFPASLSLAPQLWLYHNNSYVEMRFNYEDPYAVSLFYGKSIAFGKDDAFEFIPMLGGMAGNSFGVIPSFNLNASGKFNFASQNEYVFNLNDADANFFYDWTTLSTPIFHSLSAGLGFEALKTAVDPIDLKEGVSLSLAVGKFTTELYCFNFWETPPFFLLGIEFDL